MTSDLGDTLNSCNTLSTSKIYWRTCWKLLHANNISGI